MADIIFIEGQDKTGKDTLIKNLVRNYFSKNPMVLHCIGPKETGEEGFTLSRNYYDHLLKLITTNDNFFILNRSHLGELIYAPIYRDYSGDYVIDLEKQYGLSERNSFLFTLIDSSHDRLSREDGDALSTDIKKSHKEMIAFITAYSKSTIRKKRLIDIKNLNEHQVFELVRTFYEDSGS